MTVTLYSCADDKRKITKTLTDSRSLSDVTVTHPCDLMHPELLLDATVSMGWDALNKNYAYISTFGRYYFIDDYTIDSAARVHLHLSIDPLYTYGAQILATSQHVVRSESVNGGKSTMIVDDKIPVASYKDMKVILFEGGELGLSNATDSSLNYILNVAGGAGA